MEGGFYSGGTSSSSRYPRSFSRYGLINHQSNARAWNNKYKYKSRENSGRGGDLTGVMELARGPRADSRSNPAKSQFENEQLSYVVDWDSYNLSDFQIVYEHAKFYVIKSFCEDDVHKCIKYNVNASGQFVGVAEMIGPVDFTKNMDFWQVDKWNDIPSTLLRHIILKNNENKVVTNSRDTQEVELNQGLQMLSIFMKYKAKTSVLDDFIFYENREKALRVKRNACQPKKSDYEGGEDEKGDELDLTSLSLSIFGSIFFRIESVYDLDNVWDDSLADLERKECNGHLFKQVCKSLWIIFKQARGRIVVVVRDENDEFVVAF
ncbi:hypothetical protein ACS0TY_002128 [Phlomoides rotata]